MDEFEIVIHLKLWNVTKLSFVSMFKLTGLFEP